ncbi:MAG TPA: MmgE/PrpD family protein, partial [Hyphomonadaceae bacterium]|nr:MmgE/PrpD family protein [Hyphomonadaceae bacterium]
MHIRESQLSALREIAWRAFDNKQQAGLAYQYAEYALGLDYEVLPEDVVHQAKRCLLDALGCAFGGYDSPARAICEDTLAELGGTPEATVIGSGMRTNAANANLLNCLMVRFLDFNDLGGGGHNSDAIPSLLAIAERQKASGREFITSLVASYELGSRLNAGVNNWHGWVHDTRAALIVPPAIGRMLGLSAAEIAHAIGIAASGNSVLSILDVPGEDKPMRKNLRFGWTASAAILATLLASKGFTGPLRVFEGEGGMNEVMFKGEANLELMTDFRGWLIHDTRFKFLCATAPVQGVLQATLELVWENDLKPEQIAKVRVRMYEGASAIRPAVPIKYPRNAESADHSVYYLTAIAIKEREVSADSISPEKFT